MIYMIIYMNVLIRGKTVWEGQAILHAFKVQQALFVKNVIFLIDFLLQETIIAKNVKWEYKILLD